MLDAELAVVLPEVEFSDRSNRLFELLSRHTARLDLERRTVRVGKSKTEAGTGRTIPLNDKATKVMKFWAEQFPNREPEHYVFPSERYGAGGDKFEPTVYNVEPTKRSIPGRKHGDPSKKKQAFRSGFTTFDTPS